jgi:error-prone DNA polymerase
MTMGNQSAPPSPRNNDLANVLARLREAAPGAVWLGASMLYRGDEARRLARLAALAAAANVPLIAVGDVLYHAAERRALQDVVTCIRAHLTLDTAGRRLEANAERHLKSADEMARLFRAAPEAVAETLRFLARCRFSLDELAYEYPDEIRAGFATPQEALVTFAEEGARRRYPHGVPPKVRHALDHEYALIGELNYAPYFSPCMTSCGLPARRAFSARAAAPPRTPPSATASASPRSIPSARIFCSSASSRPNGASRPTSTSISSTSGARR